MDGAYSIFTPKATESRTLIFHFLIPTRPDHVFIFT